MLKSDELKQERAAKAEEAQAIYDLVDKESRQLTKEESEKFDALMSEVDNLDRRVKNQVKIEAALKDKASDPSVQPTVDKEVPKVQSMPYRGKLLAFRGERGGVKPEERAYNVGMWAAAALFKNQKAVAFCDEHGIPLEFDRSSPQAAQGESTFSGGGALVPDQFIDDLIDLQERYGVARNWCYVQPMSSDYATTPRRTGGLTAYAVGENTEPTESNMTFDDVGLTAKKWMVLTKYSSEWAADSAINVADLLFREAGIAFATAEDDALFNGTGAATYHGIQGLVPKFGDGSSYAGATDPTTSAADTFAEIAAVDIALLMSKAPKYALDMAWFYCSQPAFSLVFERLAQAAGGNTKGDDAAGTPYRYQGYPVGISQKMPLSGANNQVMLLFGNMAQAVTFGDRRRVSMRVLTERYAELDQLAVVATERFDINVHDIGDSNTAGPLVALIGAS